MLDRLYNLSTSKLFIAVFVVLVLYLMFVMSPASPVGAVLQKDIPKDVKIMDLRQTYSPAEAYGVLDKLGGAGRSAYLRNLMTIDVALPLLYSSAFSVLIAFLLKKTGTRNKMIRWIALVPLVNGAFDLAENAAVSLMILNYPKQIDLLAMNAAFFTMAKWSLMNAVYYIVLAEFAWLTFNSLKDMIDRKKVRANK